jgi:hypothetical protein
MWIFTITDEKVGQYLAITACFASYSFVAFNIVDLKFFLPSAFAWMLGFGVFYIVFSKRFDVFKKAILCTILSITIFSYHFYTGILVLGTIFFARILSLIINTIKDRGRKRLMLFQNYPLMLVFIVLLLQNLNLGIAIPGGGPANTGIVQSIILLFKSISPFVWLVPVVEISVLVFLTRQRLDSMHHVFILTLFVYFIPLSSSYRVLYWASSFASILTIISIKNSILGSCQKNYKSRRIFSVFLGVLIFIALLYPAYIPFSRDRTYFIETPTGKIATNYSFSEYNSALFMARNYREPKILIISDRGYSVVLGGLTGKEAIRLRGNLSEEFQGIMRNLHNRTFDNLIVNNVIELIRPYYLVESYEYLLFALSARTYAYIGAESDITFYAPLSPENLNPVVRENLLSSNLLDHIYHEEDVDLFLYPL